MGRVFSIRFLLGVVLVVLGGLCVLVFARITLPSTVTVLVATVDLKPGDPLTQNNVHFEDWMQVDTSNILTAEQVDQVRGGRVAAGERIPAGHPISMSQLVFDSKLNNALKRVTLLAQPGFTVFPIDMTPGQVGNWITPGDYVDLIFTVGSVQTGDIPVPTAQPPGNSLSNPGATPPSVQPIQSGIIGAGGQPTPGIVQVPIATVPLINVRVLRVDHEQKQTYVTSANGGQVSRMVDGDVNRIYVELSPQDAMVVGFLLQSGTVRAASHYELIDGKNPYPGLTWTDFVNWFMSRRPDLFPQATPGAQAVQPTPIAGQ